MKYKKLKEINEYVSKSISPMAMPEQKFEMYSVPIYDTGHPEYLFGSEIASNKLQVQKNDVLLCKINPRINRVWVVADESEYPCIASSEWIVIRNSEYNPEFLAWYFRSSKFQQLMVSEVTGIGGSLTRAQPKAIAEYPVPIVERTEQDKIVNVLNKINSVITARKTELQKLDDLVKSRFVEMFGDMKNNPKSWPIKSFSEMSEIITDGEHATPKRATQGIYLLSARNVMNHHLQLDQVDYIDELEYGRIAKRIIPSEGDILISCSGTVGRCCVIPANFKCQMVRSVALIRFNKKINPIFAEYMITSEDLQRQIGASKTASSQANLFQGKIAKLQGFIPDEGTQLEFVDFVKQVDKSKVAVQKSLDEMQVLFDALMQKYFG
ncbi:MAG: restriction endonuclease subunit S [Lachnospiraceae bacterium]|jgi:type I restriction enzyme S subunit|nr:restriction endonuclease subunit S [Lachnospiraceae bacterium]MCI1302294.1 restriction endonuclease subunit S [Lachnospiraceae bacterium]MCI1331460.1 restriction endonuclease subunit S [Lachnospiraceae bacterium]